MLHTIQEDKMKSKYRDLKVTGTDHPHIVKVERVCGGRPVIDGTRLDVRTIVSYYKMGMTPEEFLSQWNYITPAQYFDALSYYFDNKDEIETYILENHKAYEKYMKANK